MKVGGIILGGGESRRMGRPKAWLPVGSETMLARIVRIVRRVVEPVVVVGAPEQDLPALSSDVLVVRDAVAGRGPLEGLAAGLRALPVEIEAAYVSACDVPLLREEFIRYVVASLADAEVAVPYTDGHHHPLAAVYRTRVADQVDRLLAADRLRPFFLFESVSTRTLTADEIRRVDPELMSLRNLNTPEEYEAVLRELGTQSGDEE